ncbi:MAG: hypothetical protein AAGN35_00710 [Bacteroidota bacterium]
MKAKFVLGFIMLGGLFGPPSNPQQAREKYDAEQFAEANPLYQAAMEEYADQRPHLNYNIGQCWMRQDSAAKALGFYSKSTNIGKQDPVLASLAWNQIGSLHASRPELLQNPSGGSAPNRGQSQAGGSAPQQVNPLEVALEDYKNALRLDHENETARYNYELIKRKLQQQQQQQQQPNEDEENKDDQQNQDQQNEQKNQQDEQKKDQQDQNKKDQQDQQKDPEQTKENKGNQGQQPQPDGEGQEQKMSMQQAKMLLEALNQNEKKFLQQLQKSKAKAPRRNRGPEW